MTIGDPVTVDGRLAHVEALDVHVRFEDGERRTVQAEECAPWRPANAAATEP